MKYGKYEYERAYLLASFPENQAIVSSKKIRDKYLDGTRLRLRIVEKEGKIVYKLTQKEELSPNKKGILKIDLFGVIHLGLK